MKGSNVVVAVSIMVASQTLAATPTGPVGTPSEELATCLVRSTTDDDRAAIIQWVVAMLLLHPDVTSLATIPESRRHELSKQFGLLCQRLLTESCGAQAREAVKVDGHAALGKSFNVLAQSAVLRLMSDPSVASGMCEFIRYIDQEKLQKAVGLSK